MLSLITTPPSPVAYICIFICIYLHTLFLTHLNSHKNTHAHTHLNTYIHTQPHTHTHAHTAGEPLADQTNRAPARSPPPRSVNSGFGAAGVAGRSSAISTSLQGGMPLNELIPIINKLQVHICSGADAGNFFDMQVGAGATPHANVHTHTSIYVCLYMCETYTQSLCVSVNK